MTTQTDETRQPLPQVGPTPVRPAKPEPRKANEHGCTDCGKRWAGFKVCHCAICCELFSTVANFDRHNPSYAGCLAPAAAGLVLSAQGVWRQPGPEKEITR